MEQRARLWQIIRPQDIVWIAMFAALAAYGPDLTKESTTVLLGLGLMQVIEPKVPFLGSGAAPFYLFSSNLGSGTS